MAREISRNFEHGYGTKRSVGYTKFPNGLKAQANNGKRKGKKKIGYL